MPIGSDPVVPGANDASGWAPVIGGGNEDKAETVEITDPIAETIVSGNGGENREENAEQTTGLPDIFYFPMKMPSFLGGESGENQENIADTTSDPMNSGTWEIREVSGWELKAMLEAQMPTPTDGYGMPMLGMKPTVDDLYPGIHDLDTYTVAVQIDPFGPLTIIRDGKQVYPVKREEPSEKTIAEGNPTLPFLPGDKLDDGISTIQDNPKDPGSIFLSPEPVEKPVFPGFNDPDETITIPRPFLLEGNPDDGTTTLPGMPDETNGPGDPNRPFEPKEQLDDGDDGDNVDLLLPISPGDQQDETITIPRPFLSEEKSGDETDPFAKLIADITSPPQDPEWLKTPDYPYGYFDNMIAKMAGEEYNPAIDVLNPFEYADYAYLLGKAEAISKGACRVITDEEYARMSEYRQKILDRNDTVTASQVMKQKFEESKPVLY